MVGKEIVSEQGCVRPKGLAGTPSREKPPDAAKSKGARPIGIQREILRAERERLTSESPAKRGSGEIVIRGRRAANPAKFEHVYIRFRMITLISMEMTCFPLAKSRTLSPYPPY